MSYESYANNIVITKIGVIKIPFGIFMDWIIERWERTEPEKSIKRNFRNYVCIEPKIRSFHHRTFT